jgi:hypothetical protein
MRRVGNAARTFSPGDLYQAGCSTGKQAPLESKAHMKEPYRKLSLYLHPGSLLVAVAFDLLWAIPESGLTLSGFGLLLLPFAVGTVFLASFGVVTLVQHYAALDDWSTALSKGLLLGTLAAIPYSLVGMAVAGFWGMARLAYGVDEEVILLGKLTRSWRGIEVNLRRLAPHLRKESFELVIENLYTRRLISPALRNRLHELRRQRNTNMHELSTAELAALVDAVQAMENTLRVRFLNMI